MRAAPTGTPQAGVGITGCGKAGIVAGHSPLPIRTALLRSASEAK
jgi:hypothetical protein